MCQCRLSTHSGHSGISVLARNIRVTASWLYLAIPATFFLIVIVAMLPGYYQFAYDKKIDGPYRLQGADSQKDLSINFYSGNGATERIPSAVFEFGSDENYVVAIRRPYDRDRGILNKGQNEYFYIIRARDSSSAQLKESVRGPFYAATFEKEKRRLRLPAFTREVWNLS